MTANKHGDEQKTPRSRSPKAHVQAPPHEQGMKKAPQQAPGRDMGQFTGPGHPAQQKK
jgi:hypothetical protein